MYMNDEHMYTIAEFRIKAKEAFEIADEGKKVVITRRGVRYLLVSEDAVKEARKQPTPENKKNHPEAPGGSLFDTNPSFNERSCCQKSAPCRHWVWDIETGEGYVNSLSGRRRETS